MRRIRPIISRNASITGESGSYIAACAPIAAFAMPVERRLGPLEPGLPIVALEVLADLFALSGALDVLPGTLDFDGPTGRTEPPEKAVSLIHPAGPALELIRREETAIGNSGALVL